MGRHSELSSIGRGWSFVAGHSRACAVGVATEAWRLPAWAALQLLVELFSTRRNSLSAPPGHTYDSARGVIAVSVSRCQLGSSCQSSSSGYKQILLQMRLSPGSF
jgi:hypothetical protein